MRGLTRALMATTLLCAAGSASAATQRLEVLFVADGAGPVAYVEVTEDSEGRTLSRATAWAFFAGGTTVTRSLNDELVADPRAPLLMDLPSAPKGLSVLSAPDGTLLITLDRLGDWQAALAPEVKLERAAGGPSVASSEEARLLIEPALQTGADGPRSSPAVLYGSRGSVRGHALIDARPRSSRAGAIVLPDDKGLTTLPFPTAEASVRHFVADRATVCERPVPTAVLLWPEQAAPLRLLGSAAPACLPSGRTIVPLAGARLEPRRDVPIRAVLIDSGTPPAREGRAAPGGSAGGKSAR